jgi:predicted permease
VKFFFWRRKQRDADLENEIQSHLQFAEREHMSRGETPEQARDSARRELGNRGLVKEATRDTWGWRWLRDFIQDLRYGVRMLRGNPGFTAVAIFTLGIGIGANTAIFSLINAVILRSLPVKNPEQLVQVAGVGPGGSFWGFSYPSFAYLRDGNHVFSGVIAVSGGANGLAATVNGKAERADCQFVSGNFFTLLGVNPAAGRVFTSEEDKTPGANPVVVISYEYWNRRFHLDPSIIGKTMTLRGTSFSILGVAPKGFFGVSVGSSPDGYIPMMMEQVFHFRPFVNDDSILWIQVMGRLKPGISSNQALGDVSVLYSGIQKSLVKSLKIATQHDKDNILAQKAALLLAGNGLAFDVRKQFTTPLLLLMGIVGLVLLIACANVANLLLARGRARRKEIAVRMALGAGGGRLLRQLVTESLLLGAGGGVVGIVIALWAQDGIVALMSFGRSPLTFNLQPDLRLLLFTGAVSLLVVVLFGLAPALRATRLDVAPALKESQGNLGGERSHSKLGKALIASQVAISLILLFGTGLLVRTLINLKNMDPGFDRKNVLIFNVNPAPAGYKGATTTILYRQLLDKLERIPGIQSASLSFLVPIGGGNWTNPVDIEGYTPAANEDLSVNINSVGTHFFETLHTPLLKGRTFGPQDTEKSTPVVIVNQSMARHFFGEKDPIGKRFGWFGDTRKNRLLFTIIGVVGDAKYESLREQPSRTIYLDSLQGESEASEFEVRTIGNPSSFSSQIRQAIQDVNSGIRVSGFDLFADRVDASLGRERLMVILCSLFAGLAGLLACLGLYGVTSYGVARRRAEIGIRMALGAQQSDVLWIVQRETLRLVLIGIVIGLPAGIAASRLISSTLFNIGSYDPITITAVSLLMTGVALLAGFLPARKASRVDPIQALRNE